MAKLSFENLHILKSREGLGVALFLDEYITNNSAKINPEIEQIFDSCAIGYKKLKMTNNTIDTYFKMAYYYCINLNLNEGKKKQFLDIIKKIYDEVEQEDSFYKLICFLKLKSLMETVKMERKATFFLYISMGLCFENTELNNFLPFLFQEIRKKFNINDIYNDKIENPESFTNFHKIIYKCNWKKVAYNQAALAESKKDMKETLKKRIDKENKLYITKRGDSLKSINLSSHWDSIYYNMYINFLNFYKLKGDQTMKIAYGMSYLQTLAGYLSTENQNKLANEILIDSSLLQEKIFLNLLKLPILMKIIPLSSDIKFDIRNQSSNLIDKVFKPEKECENGQNPDSPAKIFLYNPWEKEDGINYYWTENSFQKVYIQFFNPLSLELKINKIVLIFEQNKPFSFPTSTILQPNSVQGVICKLRPNKSGLTNIMGIKYEIFNSDGVQFVDSNGNGLFYHYVNYSRDSLLNNNKLEKINLRNIKIFPEIPQLEIKVLDSSSKIINGSLDLFEHQYYNFSFLLKNTGEYPVTEIFIQIFAFKKDDYKISFDEITIKSQENSELISKGAEYTLNYTYLHRKIFKKIEFKIYYSCTNKSSYDRIMRPYLYYQKPLTTLKLFNLSSLKVLPMLSSNMIHLITQLDPKINKEYSKYFCSDKYYVSFSIGNPNDDIINFNIYARDNFFKSEACESKNTKEISFVVNSEIRMSEFVMNWEFDRLNNVKGHIDLGQIFKEFSFKFKTSIKFDINCMKQTMEGVDYFSIDYMITNNNEHRLNNLKFYVYLYQVIDEDNILYNNQLLDDISYEGSLSYIIKTLNINDSIKFNLKVFPSKYEYISTTCLIVDQENKMVYMSPISRSFYLNI